MRDATRSPPDLAGWTDAVAMAFRVGSREGRGRNPAPVGASLGDVNALNGFALSSVGDGSGEVAYIKCQKWSWRTRMCNTLVRSSTMEKPAVARTFFKAD